MTRQEMFDKAVKGLRSQGFKRAYSLGGCVYVVDKIDDHTELRRCAWGWVDETLTPQNNMGGNIYDLAEEGIGLAAKLDIDDLGWARQLQSVHDKNDLDMELRLRDFAMNHGLNFPEGS